MTLNSGDLISCGTNHEGLGPLQDGERVRIEIHGIGAMELNVEDPLKRSWERVSTRERTRPITMPSSVTVLKTPICCCPPPTPEFSGWLS